MVKLGFGLSANTLAKCGIDEKALMLDMVEGSYVINKVLPWHLMDERSDDTSVARLFAQLDKQEQEQQAARERQVTQQARASRLALFGEFDGVEGSIAYCMLPKTIEDELRIDAAYVRCYADFVKFGILEPITYDELKEFEENQQEEFEG
jgi:hypothetical protein